MDASPLAKLPPELRNATFELVFVRPCGLVVDMEDNCPRLAEDQVEGVRNALSLMGTCKQIRQECLYTSFAVNEFVIDTGALDYITYAKGTPKAVQETDYRQTAKSEAWLIRGWLHSLGKSSLYLRSVNIHLGRWSLQASPAPTASLAAWIIEHFHSVFAATGNVKIKFLFEVIWSDAQPPVTVEVSMPANERGEHSVNKDLDSVRDGLLARFDDDDHQDLFNELNDCDEEVRVLFWGLRHPQRLLEKARPI